MLLKMYSDSKYLAGTFKISLLCASLRFLLSVLVLSFKWGHRDNFSLFIELHEAKRTVPRAKVCKQNQ